MINSNSVYLLSILFIKIHFHYIVPNRGRCIPFVLKVQEMNESIILETFKNSILINSVASLIMLQSSDIVWKSFSLIYPTGKTHHHDHYLIPLNNVYVQQIRIESTFRGSLSIQLRFRHRLQPKSVKIYGNSSCEVKNIKYLEVNLRKCEAVSFDTLTMHGTNMTCQVVIRASKINKDINDKNRIRPIKTLVTL